MNRAALDLLAASAISREVLKTRGYHSLGHSSCLFRHGYRVRHWLRLSDGHVVLDYLARSTVAKQSDLPRLTASSYEEQCAVHRALGLHVVPRGCDWRDDSQPLLFGPQPTTQEKPLATLFDRRSQLRQLLVTADEAIAARQKLAQALWHAETAADAVALLPALSVAIDREMAAEQALPGPERPTVSNGEAPSVIHAEAYLTQEAPAANPEPAAPTRPPRRRNEKKTQIGADQIQAPSGEVVQPSPEGEQGAVPTAAAPAAAPSPSPVASADTGAPPSTSTLAATEAKAPLWWRGEDLGKLGVSPEKVEAAYCADKLAAGHGIPTVKPVGKVNVSGKPHVNVSGTNKVPWHVASLQPIMLLAHFEKEFPGEQTCAVSWPDGRQTYRGRMVMVGKGRKAERYVLLGEAVARQVCWCDDPWQAEPAACAKGYWERFAFVDLSNFDLAGANQQQMDALERAKKQALAASSEAEFDRAVAGLGAELVRLASPPSKDGWEPVVPTMTGTLQGILDRDASRAAAKRTCEVCGVCDGHCAEWLTAKRCSACGNAEYWGKLKLAAPAAGCVVEAWTHPDGRATARATPGHLGNWHTDDSLAAPSPTTGELIEAIGKATGLAFGDLEACQLDDSDVIVLQLHPVPIETPTATPSGVTGSLFPDVRPAAPTARDHGY